MADQVLFQQHGAALEVTLDRPKALNSLSTPMLRQIAARLVDFQVSMPGRLKIVYMTGAGDKAFCAGGDVMAIERGRLQGDFTLGPTFFRTNFTVDHLLSRLALPPPPALPPSLRDVVAQAERTWPAPAAVPAHVPGQPPGCTAVVAVMDRVTMGGGVGMAVHGPFRIATERTVFAMPEVSIGFFPDVGCTHFLHHLPAGVGAYLALTGLSIRGGVVRACGAATHFVPSARLPALREAVLGGAGAEAGDLLGLDRLLQQFTEPIDAEAETSFAHLATMAKAHFAGKRSVVDIMEALRDAPQDRTPEATLAADALDAMTRASPTSLVIAFEALRRGGASSLDESLQLEFRIAARLTSRVTDFHEGVRCRLVDRGHAPRWEAGSVAEVDVEGVIARFFGAFGPGEGPELQLESDGAPPVGGVTSKL